VAPNETPPVGRNVGNTYDRQNNLRFGTERFKKVERTIAFDEADRKL
jgi:hypothetical protein